MLHLQAACTWTVRTAWGGPGGQPTGRISRAEKMWMPLTPGPSAHTYGDIHSNTGFERETRKHLNVYK